jgi:hypothetical protein
LRAAGCGHTETVTELVRLGAAVDARTSVGSAQRTPHPSYAAAFMCCAWLPQDQRITALMKAAANNKRATVTELVRLGADVNARDKVCCRCDGCGLAERLTASGLSNRAFVRGQTHRRSRHHGRARALGRGHQRAQRCEPAVRMTHAPREPFAHHRPPCRTAEPHSWTPLSSETRPSRLSSYVGVPTWSFATRWRPRVARRSQLHMTPLAQRGATALAHAASTRVENGAWTQVAVELVRLGAELTALSHVRERVARAGRRSRVRAGVVLDSAPGLPAQSEAVRSPLGLHCVRSGARTPSRSCSLLAPGPDSAHAVHTKAARHAAVVDAVVVRSRHQEGRGRRSCDAAVAQEWLPVEELPELVADLAVPLACVPRVDTVVSGPCVCEDPRR